MLPFYMRRFLAISVLAAGLLPSVPAPGVSAGFMNQHELILYCRNRLGYGPTNPLYGKNLLRIRRCIDSARHEKNAETALQKPVHYTQLYQNVEPGAKKEMRRSLHKRVYGQQDIRKQYYLNTDINDRAVAMNEHRKQRRAEVQQPQRLLMRELRAKQFISNGSIRSCVYYISEKREECVIIQVQSVR